MLSDHYGEKGQSPLMRGKPSLQKSQTTQLGSIPAHAGETEAPIDVEHAEAVNPRSCGGNWTASQHETCIHGQSPLMRGKPRDGGILAVPGGSIPAHAGETSPAMRRGM